MTINSMLTGAHAILYSQNLAEDRAFLRDVLGLPHVDAGDGWLILSLPPSKGSGVRDQGSGRSHQFSVGSP
jgi:hypothetical protein